jgi:hypothetical protein
MSAVAALFNVPSTQTEFDAWAFAHAAHHRDIIRSIYNLSGVVLDEYVLDPLNPNDTNTWLYQHQLMHSQMDPILGIAGYDLLDVDFKNREELSGWIWLNSQEHYQAANTLAIG